MDSSVTGKSSGIRHRAFNLVYIAETAAQLRATYNLRSPDAIQMATAIREGSSFFLTNDARLPSLPGLTVLVLENLR
jgi:predicted nucleic acid-binding protein